MIAEKEIIKKLNKYNLNNATTGYNNIIQLIKTIDEARAKNENLGSMSNIFRIVSRKSYVPLTNLKRNVQYTIERSDLDTTVSKSIYKIYWELKAEAGDQDED